MENVKNIHSEKHCKVCRQPILPNSDAEKNYNNHYKKIVSETEAKFKLSPQQQAEKDKKREEKERKRKEGKERTKKWLFWGASPAHMGFGASILVRGHIIFQEKS